MGQGSTLRPLFSWRAAIADSDLTSTHRHVAIALSLYANERGGSMWPGPTRLAHDTGLHESTVKEKLGDLEAAGWIVCVRRGGGRGRANEYELAVPKPSPTATLSEEKGSSSASETVAHGDPNSYKNSQEREGPLFEAPRPEADVPHETSERAARSKAGRALNATKRRTTPEAHTVACEIWEGLDPKPILRGQFPAFRGLIDAALKAGWDARSIRAVAPQVDTWASWSLNQALRQYRRRHGAGGYDPDAN